VKNNKKIHTERCERMSHPPNGNLTKDPQHQYGWDSEGRPVTIDTSITLTYDALDRMVEQNNSGTYTQIVYDPLGEKFGLMNGQTLKKAFAPLPDGGIAAYTSTGLSYYRHPDWLGSSRLASTPTRTIYSDTAYAPFGEPYAQSGTADVSFTGQNQDTASNLYDFLFREHSSIQGRWISPDPAGLAAVTLTDPQSWNRYAYVRNSPVLFADFLGLTCFKKVTNDDGSIGIMNEELPYDNESDCNSHGGSWITSTTTIQVNGGVPDGGDPTSPVLPLPDPPGFSTNGSGSANGPQSPGQTPRQAATQYCQQHGQLSFNIPFTHIPVTISLSATLGPANYSATNDINTVFPVFPWPEWLAAGASVDFTVNAPAQPTANPSVGLGKNLSLGYFTNHNGPQGISLSVGPSIGPPINVAVPTNNACGMLAGGN
jgi:RHS repeat-associated protein